MNSHQEPYNLLIADDHRLITDGISKILEEEKTIGDIYVANNGRETVDKALAKDIDCVIMDINMPVLNGVEATKLIKQEKPYIKIIVVSMISDASIVTKLLKAGADGFINKDTGKTELVKALEKVMNGEKYLSPDISNNLINHFTVSRNASTEVEKPLTPRELEIVRYIADGLTNHQIAQKLFLSVVTIDTHRKNVLAKLRLKNTASLVKYAMENKLL
ncbi:MAG: response regulator [Ginsengibacter sp.]